MAQIHKHGIPSKIDTDKSLVMVNLSSSSIILRQSSHPLRIRFLRIRYFLYFMFLHRSLVFMCKSIYDPKELRLIFPLLFSPCHYFYFVYFYRIESNMNKHNFRAIMIFDFKHGSFVALSPKHQRYFRDTFNFTTDHVLLIPKICFKWSLIWALILLQVVTRQYRIE